MMIPRCIICLLVSQLLLMVMVCPIEVVSSFTTVVKEDAKRRQPLFVQDPTANVATAASGSFQQQKNALFSWLSPLSSPFNSNKNNNNSKTEEEERERKRLKQALLEACAPNNNNPNSNLQQQRAQVEAAIEALREYSPVKETAASPLLRKKWKVIWTTEKEIVFFFDNGWSNEITQTIFPDGNQLQNMIPFVGRGGGSFRVQGKLVVPDPPSVRTEFEFTSAILTLPSNFLGGIFGDNKEWKFPPVGKGWFDTIYLDETLRVDTNSRNDILICEALD